MKNTVKNLYQIYTISLSFLNPSTNIFWNTKDPDCCIYNNLLFFRPLVLYRVNDGRTIDFI